MNNNKGLTYAKREKDTFCDCSELRELVRATGVKCKFIVHHINSRGIIRTNASALSELLAGRRDDVLLLCELLLFVGVSDETAERLIFGMCEVAGRE